MTAGVLTQKSLPFSPTLLETKITMGKVCASDTTKDLPDAFTPEYCVRNTFIDSASSRRPSLEDFLPRSRCFSAPAPVVGVRIRHVSTIDPVCEEEGLGWDGLDANASSSNTYLHQPPPCVSLSSMPAVGSKHASGSMHQNVFMPIIVNQVGMHPSGITLLPPTVIFSAPPVGHGLLTSQQNVGSIAMTNTRPSDSTDPQIFAGVEQLPSEGSMGHNAGVCKPCAWYHSAKGCKTGISCKFCHTCAPGELKRRKKEKNMSLAVRTENAKA